MTLGQFLEFLSENPFYIISYFVLVPLTGFLAGIFGKNEGHLPPWKYLHSVLIYLASVPGIFSLTLNVYLFLFQRESIFSTNIYIQILPLVSMVATFFIIKNNVSLEQIPGFDKLSGLMVMIFSVIVLMWLIDRTRIVIFSYLSFGKLLLIFIILLILFRFGWVRLVQSSRSRDSAIR